MSLLVVIVNYRTAGLTIDCLQSLAGERYSGVDFHVKVVEGGSDDDSARVLETAISVNGWGQWVTLLIAERNGGFAYANNLAIAPALEADSDVDSIWLLNPDTYLRSGAIAPLLRTLDSAPDFGIVGSRLEDPDGTPQCSAFRFPSIWSELEDAVRLGIVSMLLRSRLVAPPTSDQAVETPWVAGASMMVRTQVFRDIGLLDATYFMYFEETDFCRRAKEKGWKTCYEPSSRVVHLVGQSSGVTGSSRALKRRPHYWFESRRRYFLSHLGGAKTVVADMTWLMGRAFWYLMQSLRGRPRLGEPPQMWSDFLRHSVLVQGFSLPQIDNSCRPSTPSLTISGQVVLQGSDQGGEGS